MVDWGLLDRYNFIFPGETGENAQAILTTKRKRILRSLRDQIFSSDSSYNFFKHIYP